MSGQTGMNSFEVSRVKRSVCQAFLLPNIFLQAAHFTFPERFAAFCSSNWLRSGSGHHTACNKILETPQSHEGRGSEGITDKQ